MKRIVFFISLIISLIGCKTNEYKDIFKLSYKGSSLMKFHVTNCHDTLNYTLYYWTYFPFGQPKQNIIFDKDSTYTLEIRINHPATISFLNGKRDQCIEFFSLPKDTLDIFFNADDTKKLAESVKYKGKTASISNYLTKGKLIVGPFPRKEDDIDFYNKHIDTLNQERLNALIEFNKIEKLPDWYIKYEKLNIEYSGAFDKLLQFEQRLSFYDQYIPKPLYFAEKLGVKINNPDALFCDEYFKILSSFYPQKYDSLLQQSRVNENIFFQYLCDNINMAKNYLDADTRSIFISSRISVLFGKNLLEAHNNPIFLGKIDSLIASAKPLITDTALYSYLLDYRNEQILALEKAKNEELKKGNKAPGFILKSLDEKIEKLSDYKGQFVVLNFWATWCVPCVKSIDQKNGLFQNYNKKGVAFINICIDSNKDQWKKIIQDNHFQGTQLICKGEWQDLLMKSYNFTGIPHLTFIDKKGNIISNDIRNISELEGFIKEELK